MIVGLTTNIVKEWSVINPSTIQNANFYFITHRNTIKERMKGLSEILY